MRYAISGIPLGVINALLVWDGTINRFRGALLILCYVAFVGIIWTLERRPPALGELEEFSQPDGGQSKSRHALIWVLVGVAGMVIGATVLVEAVRRIAHIEAAETQFGLTIVGFATGFELVVLTWRAAKRGAPDAAVAAVIGSFSYNVTMTLGTAAVARPLLLNKISPIHVPLVAMLVSLGVVVILATRRGRLSRIDGIFLLCLYPAFVALVFHRF
jgi:cation:H+ antiporter